MLRSVMGRQLIECVAALALIWLAGSPVSGFEGMALSQSLPSVARADSCIVEITGDVNESGSINSADIIYLVNWIFVRGPAPKPCTGAGDVNCNTEVTAADIIYLVNFVFKSGPQPCDICTSESGQIWGCIQ